MALAAKLDHLCGELLDLGDIDLTAGQSLRIPVPSLMTQRLGTGPSLLLLTG